MKLILIILLTTIYTPIFGQKSDSNYVSFDYSKNGKYVRGIHVLNDSLIVSIIKLNGLGQIKEIDIISLISNEQYNIGLNNWGRINKIKQIKNKDNSLEMYKVNFGRIVKWSHFVNDSLINKANRKDQILIDKTIICEYYDIHANIKQSPLGEDSTGLEIIIDPKNKKIKAINFEFSNNEYSFYFYLYRNGIKDYYSFNKEGKSMQGGGGFVFHSFNYIFIAKNNIFGDYYRNKYSFSWLGKLLYLDHIYNGERIGFEKFF